MDLETLLRRRQDELRGRPETRWERSWLRAWLRRADWWFVGLVASALIWGGLKVFVIIATLPH